VKVLVTGLFEPAALHAIRRFGQMGFEVHAAEGHLLAYSGFSRYVSKRVRLPNMRYFPKRYAERLLQQLESGGYDYYFPSYEEIILMSHFRDRALAATRSVIPTTDTLMRLHDKARLAELAREVGVDTPEILVPNTMEEAREMIATVTLPIAIKQRASSGAAGFRQIHDRAALERQYLEVVRVNSLGEGNLPMLQRLIDGPTTCTLHLCQDGRMLGEVMYRGLRTMPRTGGTTVLRESIDDPVSHEAAEKLISHLNYSGLCGFDFVIDRETGRPYVVDGNCRITPAITMAYHGGSDMIAAWCDVAAGKPVEPLPATRLGVRTKLQFADFVWLLESYMGSFKDWSGEHALRKQWWREKDHFYDVHSFRDPMPNIMIWVYIVTNCYKLIFTDFDSAQLFIFHNQYTGDGTTIDAQTSTPTAV
jgi:biotin carboxylase